MDDLSSQIQAAIPVPVSVQVFESCTGNGTYVDVYSNGDVGNTVITHHKAADGVETIVAAHMAKRSPTAQKKSRQIAARVHREVFGR